MRGTDATCAHTHTPQGVYSNTSLCRPLSTQTLLPAVLLNTPSAPTHMHNPHPLTQTHKLNTHPGVRRCGLLHLTADVSGLTRTRSPSLNLTVVLSSSLLKSTSPPSCCSHSCWVNVPRSMAMAADAADPVVCVCVWWRGRDCIGLSKASQNQGVCAHVYQGVCAHVCVVFAKPTCCPLSVCQTRPPTPQLTFGVVIHVGIAWGG